jgi:hypothetical protein
MPYHQYTAFLETKNNKIVAITTYFSILKLNVDGLNSSSQIYKLQAGLEKYIQKFVFYKKSISQSETNTGLV